MPRSRGRKNKSGSQPTPRLPQPESTRWSRTRARIAKIVGLFVAVVGFAAAIVAFWPRVTVEPAGSVDPSNPSPIHFMITNMTVIPLTNVQPAIGLCTISVLQGANCDGPLKTRFVMRQWFARTLASDEKYAIDLRDMFEFAPAALRGANISIIVSFNTWFLPLRREKEFRFITKEQNGKYYWSPLPLEK